MTITPRVADVNHANTIASPFPHGPEPAGFAALAAGGCWGFIHKASQNVADPAYARRKPIAKSAGLLWGAYHFNTSAPAADQVRLFLSSANLAADESAWLDWERNPNHDMPLAMAIDFIDQVDQKLGRACGVYSGDVVKSRIIGATAAQRDFLGKHPFWLAEYGPTARMIDANHHPLPWATPFIWQYTGDGIGPAPHTLPGLENGADLSTFNGTKEQMTAAWPSGPLGTLVAAKPAANIPPSTGSA